MNVGKYYNKKFKFSIEKKEKEERDTLGQMDKSYKYKGG